MCLKTLVCFSVICVEKDSQAVCQRHHWLRFGVATVFTYRCKRNYIEGDNLVLHNSILCN